jgi:hypothetical protein
VKRAVSVVLIAVSISCGSAKLSGTASPNAQTSTAQPSIAQTPLPGPTNSAEPTPYPSAASGPRPSPQSSPCPSPGPPGAFPTVSTSNRVLALVKLTGSESVVVRDVTDIDHPSTVTTVDLGANTPATFVGPDQLSAPAAGGLALMPLSGNPKRTVVGSCGGIWTYAWSADGSALTYVVEANFPAPGPPWYMDWHLVAGGADRVIGRAAGSCHCDGDRDVHFSFDVAFSPDGRYVSLVEDIPGGTDMQVRRLDGTLVTEIGSNAPNPGSQEFTTLGVWDGNRLFFRDSKGVEAWRDGSVASVLIGTAWTASVASPAGGQIVFALEDADGLHHPSVLDTKTGTVRALSSHAGYGFAYLGPRYLWYAGERRCVVADRCPYVTGNLPTGKTYILDLVTGTESESRITQVLDVWPHGS